MAEQRFDFNWNEFQAKPRMRRWWPKAIAVSMAVGGIYGAAIGSAISTVAWAADVIGIAAAAMAVLCAVPAARIGVFLAIFTRMRFGRLFVVAIAAVGGAILGGFLGMAAVMPLGAILGVVGGWLLARMIFQRGLFKRLFAGIVGIVAGACIGAIILALSYAPLAALVGVAWGLGIGAVIGLLPPLLFLRMMGSLAPKPHAERTIIETTFEEVPTDEIEGPP